MLPLVRLVHILVTGPLLIWIGLKEPKLPWVYKLLFAIGALLLIIFGVKSIIGQSLNIWYLIHAILFSSLLLYAGVQGMQGSNSVPRVTFGLLLAVGIAAFGYHSVRLVQSVIGG